MVLGLVLYVKMWWWTLTGLSIITKVHGFADGIFSESCDSMSVVHEGEIGQFFAPQTSKPPFEINYRSGIKGEPITVFLQSKPPAMFKGFMLEARVKGMLEGHPVGKFILLEPDTTRLLMCNKLADSAVSQRTNHRKSLIQVNWTAQDTELDITFRATFVQSYDIFWERVDKNVTFPQSTTPPPPSTQPSTTASTTVPSTSSTTVPSTSSTAVPSTLSTTVQNTSSTTVPSTSSTAVLSTSSTTVQNTSSTTVPSTSSTTVPSTSSTTVQNTSNTTVPSTSSTAVPSTTELVTTSLTPIVTTSTLPNTQRELKTSKLKLGGTVLMAFDILFVAVKMELPNIVMTTLTNRPLSDCLIKVSKISCSLLCSAAEISALILFCVAHSFKVTLIALVCAVIAINYIELVIVSLRIGPSDKLKEICDLAVKVCSVIHKIFAIAVVFVGVLEIDDCRKNRKDSWLLKVMFAYTAWIFLFVIWVFVFSTNRKAILGRSKIGSSKKSKKLRQQRKKKLSAAKVIVTAVSVILVVGTMSFTVAVIVGIFGCVLGCA